MDTPLSPDSRATLILADGEMTLSAMVRIGALADAIKAYWLPGEIETLIMLLQDNNDSPEPDESDDSEPEPEDGESEPESEPEPSEDGEVTCRNCEEVIVLDGGYWRSVDRDDFYCKHSDPPQYHEPYNAPEPSEDGEPEDGDDDASEDASDDDGDDYDDSDDYWDDDDGEADDADAAGAADADGDGEYNPDGTTYGDASPPPRVQEDYPPDILAALKALGIDPDTIKG